MGDLSHDTHNNSEDTNRSWEATFLMVDLRRDTGDPLTGLVDWAFRPRAERLHRRGDECSSPRREKRECDTLGWLRQRTL